MASQRVFSRRQWAAAFAIAAAMHALVAWSFLTSEPTRPDSSTEQGGGLTVESLSLSNTELPELADAVDPDELAMVEPPPVQPMTEVAPIEPKSKKQVKKAQPARKPTAPATERTDRAGKGKGSSTAKAGADRTATPASSNPHPRYPPSARSRGHEGRVLIRVSVLDSGRVGSARVAKSSGHGSLDRAALKAVKRWRFSPALRAGRPVTATLTVPVTFRLEG